MINLTEIRERDSSWGANYAEAHPTDGYGRAAHDRRLLLAEIDRYRQFAQAVIDEERQSVDEGPSISLVWQAEELLGNKANGQTVDVGT